MAELHYRNTPEQSLQSLGSTHNGLSTQEAAARAAKYGPNKLSEGKKKSTLQVFLEQFKDLLVIILLVAACISAA